MPDMHMPNPEEDFRERGGSETLEDQDILTISQRLGSLALDETTAYREHQEEAFHDIVAFFRAGGKETYAQLPTGTGKTVLFVELAKRLVESSAQDGQRTRVIVLEPTVELIPQTIGVVDEDRNIRKGFKGFAPDLKVGAYHGKSTEKQRKTSLTDADVLVTTYNSFRNLIATFKETDSQTEENEAAEYAKHLEFLGSSRHVLANLRRQRDSLLAELYAEQEVASFKAVLDAQTKREDLTPSEKAILDTLVQSVQGGSSDKPEARAVLTDIRRGLAKVGRAHRNIAQIYAERKREQEEGAIDAIDPEVEEKLSTSIPHKPSLIENFVVDRMVRYLNRSSISVFELHKREDRERVNSISFDIQNMRPRENYARNRLKAIDRARLVRETVGQFSLIICDEAHRSIGEETWNTIRAYAEAKDMAILGLTATDKYENRSLMDYFESKSHELSKEQAFERKLINPTALFVRDTGVQVKAEVDSYGEYQPTSLRELRHNQARNNMIADDAVLLVEAGYRGFISAIPGDEGEHARILADLLRERDVRDPKTGEIRAMRAAAVTQKTQGKAVYFQALERDELDWITFIDVVREGIDIPPAKALLNGRPTRSALLAEQRAGRIGRTYEGAPVSIAIDYFDGIVASDSTTQLPPVLTADVYGIDDVDQGHIVGQSENASYPVIEQLKQRIPGTINAYNTRYKKLVDNLPRIDHQGSVRLEGSRSTTEWQTYDAIRRSYRGFLPKEIIMEELAEDEPQIRAIQGRKGNQVELLFNIKDIENLHTDKPEINPWKLHITEEGQRRITPEGCTKMFVKAFPHLSTEDIIEAIHALEQETDEPFDKEVARIALPHDKSGRKLGFIHTYDIEEITNRLVPYLREHRL